MYTLSHFPFSWPQLADSSLHKWNQTLGNHFWYQSISVHFFFLQINTVNQMDCKSMRLLAVHVSPLYYRLLLRLGFSPFISLVSIPPIWKQTSRDLQPHQSIPVHIKKTKAWEQTESENSPKPTKLRHKLFPDVKTELKETGFVPTFLLYLLPSLCSSFTRPPSPAPAAVCFSSPADLDKSQHCKIHMMSSGNVDMRK